MQQRWYDKDPTLSMAFSLLNNASPSHQDMTARYLFKLIENLDLDSSQRLRTQEDKVRFIFPGFRRNELEMSARHLIETIKHLAPEDQQSLALQLINYIYILDCGLTDFPMEELEMSEMAWDTALARPEMR